MKHLHFRRLPSSLHYLLQHLEEFLLLGHRDILISSGEEITFTHWRTEGEEHQGEGELAQFLHTLCPTLKREDFHIEISGHKRHQQLSLLTIIFTATTPQSVEDLAVQILNGKGIHFFLRS